jgi:hypothetical protein
VKKLLSRILRPAAQPGAMPTRSMSLVELAWRSEATMPIADWRDAWERVDAIHEEAAVEQFFWNAAFTWLDALRGHLGNTRYRIDQTASFLVLSSLENRKLQLALEFCERSRRRILRMLADVAQDKGYGPHVVLIFDSIDEYYDYVSNYHAKGGTYSMSSGMFIQRGYGHFVFVASDMYAMEPIIAHELTHCLLASLPIPAWLNEGTAVNVEKQLVPENLDPRRGIFEHREARKKRSMFWTEETIQEYWSGKSFRRPDEGCSLSYELAEQMTRLIARNNGEYRAYMNSAQRDDAGAAAATELLGYTLEELATAVLGPGRWAPAPEKWHAGTEAGQF